MMKKSEEPSAKPKRSTNKPTLELKTRRQSFFNETFLPSVCVQIINDDGEVVTPITLNPLLYEKAIERQMFVFETDEVLNRSSGSALLSKLVVTDASSRSEAHGTIGTASIFSEETSILAMPEQQEGSGFIFQEVDESDLKKERLPDMTKVELKLVETDTTFILEIACSTLNQHTREGAIAEADNRTYEYLTQGKGRNRKTISAEVQTVPMLTKTRETIAFAPRKKHNHAFASDWDMYDTYTEHPTVEVEEDYNKTLELVGNISRKASMLSYETSMEEKQLQALVKTDQFFHSLCLMERMLASNNFHKVQKRFRGLDDPSPFRENIEYKYNLTLLWTFANHRTNGRCVTGICWNPKNKNMLAVAYGKFFYGDNTTGMIMIWNIKNPVQPERTYDFAQPVTAVDFSNSNSNLLAVGFYDGSLYVIDISSRLLNVIYRSRDTYPSYEPIWQVVWYIDHDYFKGTEFLLTSCQDGRISRFRIVKNMFLDYSHMMRVAVAEGRVKGLQKIRGCVVPGISIIRYPSALVLRHHPVDPNIYYVGTGDGVVHKCSKNYYHQHLDLFMGHDGPMYEIKFSPFCDKLFLTCGDDWTVRIWCDGIGEHLFELKKSMQSVQGADWSPSHSTVLASICGSDIFIWDLQRKTYAPQSETHSPTKARCTVIRFTDDGRCLIVGDIMGNIHVFTLDDMPFPAMFQASLLSRSVNRGLVTRPDLIAKIKSLGGFIFDKKTYQKYDTE